MPSPRLAALLLCAFLLQDVVAADALPNDVLKYTERRDSCDHWRGEAGYDEERKAEIDWAACQSCPGSDSGLARLKAKYKSNAAVMARLADYELRIEPLDARARAKICKGVPKERPSSKK